MEILKERGYKIQRNEKKPPKEPAFFSVPPTLPDTKRGNHRFVLDKVAHQTGKAYLVEIYGKQYWLPKSHCSAGLDHRKAYVIDIPEWLVKAKGIPL